LHVTIEDAYCLSSLIKQWFRDLPQRLLKGLDLSPFVKDEKSATNLISSLQNELQKGLFVWLIDLLIQTLKFRQENKMEPKELAVVISPLLIENMTEDSTSKLETVATVLYYILSKQCGDQITVPHFDKAQLLQYTKAE